MTVLTERLSPLSGWSARFQAAAAASGRFSIREVPFTTQINLRGNPADTAFRGKVRSAIECDLPPTANTWSGSKERNIIWLGPDEWLISAPEGYEEQFSRSLREALKGMRHAVSVVSASRTIIEIAGEEARVALAKGCLLDMHSGSFKPPQTAQTLLAKSQIILQCVDMLPTFRLYVRSSFAHYVSEWLLDAASEMSASRGIDTDRIASRLA